MMRPGREEEIMNEFLGMIPIIASEVLDTGNYDTDEEDEFIRYMADCWEAVANHFRTRHTKKPELN